MQRKKRIWISAVMAASLCTAAVTPVFGGKLVWTAAGNEESVDASQTAVNRSSIIAVSSESAVDASQPATVSNESAVDAGESATDTSESADSSQPVADASQTTGDSSWASVADDGMTGDGATGDGTVADGTAGSETDTPYTQGVSTETDYQSEWLNLKFTPPETVVMNTQEELDSVMKQGQTTLEESSGVELGEDALSGTVYEMMASSISGFPNVSLVVEDAALANMTVDQYFLAAQQVMDATGLGYTYDETTDAQIAGQDFRIMVAHVMVDDYEVIQKYCTRKQGGKFVSIILSYTADTTEEADEILAAFTPLSTDTEAAPAE